MATDIVGSLFGVTPEMLQQRQFEMADRQAQEYAQLSPLQRASYGLARGGYQLAGALGGEDPQLRMVSTRNTIARQIDPTDPQSMMRGIQALQQAGDQVGAMQLAQVLRQAENDMALRSQRQAAALASTAQAGKTQQEVDSLKRQREGYRRFRAGETGQAPATAAAVEAAQVIAATTPSVGLTGVERIRQEFGDEAARFYDEKGYFYPGAVPDAPPSPQTVTRETFASNMAASGYPISIPPSLAARLPDMAAAGYRLSAQPTTEAPTAPASPTAPAAPSDIAAQIKVLEDRRRQLNTLFPDITEAKNESEDLKEQIKVLRDQMKPADVGQDREAFSSQLFGKRYSQLDSTQQAAVNEKIDEKKTYGEEAERISLADYGKTFSRLTQDQRVAVNKKIADAKNQSFGVDRESIALEVYNKPFLQLTQVQRAAVNKRLEDEQGKKAERGAAKFITTQETEFAKGLGQAQKARYENALTLRENAISALNTFDQLSRLNDQGLISGSFATGRVGATNLLNTLGLISASDSATLARSENYQKVAGDAILAALGGKLGAGFSNEDRKFIQSLVPQLENSAAARRQLIDFMVSKNRSIVGETTRLIDYAENKRTLNGFVPSVPLPSGGAGGGVQALSDEELRRRYEAARKK